MAGDEIINVPYAVWSQVGQNNIKKLADDPSIAQKFVFGAAPAAAAASSGGAKDDLGFVIAPQIAIEYDNGLLHADVNFRYIHAVKDLTYNGVGTAQNDGYQLAGPLAMFIGAGFGINF